MLRHGACITLSESSLEIGGALLSLLRAKGDLVGSRKNWLLEDPTCNFHQDEVQWCLYRERIKK